MNDCVISYYSFALHLSEHERKSLEAVSGALFTPPSIIVRRLVHYILEEKITHDDMVEAIRKLKLKIDQRGLAHMPHTSDTDEPPLPDLRITLDQETEKQFRAFAKSFGTSPGHIATQLTRLYLAGTIKQDAIWEWDPKLGWGTD
jgi:predicted Rossmann fold nucleotide-binding protein DprA/Smf involved in DNA uptake